MDYLYEVDKFTEGETVYYFAPGDLDIKREQHVIVETARGMEYGTVIGEKREVAEENIIRPLGKGRSAKWIKIGLK